MKRLFALLLALVMVLSLAACGGNAGPAASPDAPAADAPAADAPTEELQNVTDLKVDLSAIPEAAAYKEELVIAEEKGIYGFAEEQLEVIVRGLLESFEEYEVLFVK